jgi:hypothetical protein
MARQRKRPHGRPTPPKHGPLDKPTRSYVVMRYEVRTPPGMSPEWMSRESPPIPDEAYAFQLYEGALAELVNADEKYPMGAPLRDPYLVRCEVYETPLTKRLEDARRLVEHQADENERVRAELEAHLAAGGTVEIGTET